MAHARKVRMTAAAAVLMIGSLAWADAPKASPRSACDDDANCCCAQALTRRVISLADLGPDPHLAAWLVTTLPEVIEPGSWSKPHGSGKGVLSHFPAGRILVVYHTAAVVAEVEAFIKNVKQTLTTGPRHTGSSPGLLQATFVTPTAPTGSLRTAGTALVPVPPSPTTSAPTTAPEPRKPAPASRRHLFEIIVDGFSLTQEDGYKLNNLTLRYEGEGIIDSNIVELLRGGVIQSVRQDLPPGLVPTAVGPMPGLVPGALMPMGPCAGMMCPACPMMMAPAARFSPVTVAPVPPSVRETSSKGEEK